MRRDKVLIVTSKDDSHADFVIAQCNDRGYADRVVRLNTEDFNVNCRATFDGSSFRLRIRDSHKIIASDEIKSVWYRRPKDSVLPGEDDPYVSEFIKKQSTTFLRGIYFCCHDSSLWINPLPALHRSRIKLQQLQLAKQIGLVAPRTVVTNEPEEAMQFLNQVDVICTKSLDEPGFIADKNIFPLFTRVIRDKGEIALNQASIARCPVMFQEYIDKKFDIRVVIMGDTVFAFEIHSQENSLSLHDFRGVAPKFLKHSPHQLPADLTEKIQTFVKQQGLIFSAIDLVLSACGEYVFLENNPNGQWLWLQLETGFNLSDRMIELLFE